MSIQSILWTILRSVLAAGGLIFLSCGSFSRKQFENDTNWKAIFFISFSLAVAVFVYMPRRCNDALEKLCHTHFFLRAMVKFLLLGFYSTLLFFTKYPRLNKIHSKSTKEQGEKLSNGNRNDLFGVGSFSVLALAISWERKQSEEFGVFEFLLELTMDASMEIPGHGGGPNLRYMVCAYVCCCLLLIIKSYRGHGNGEVRREGADQYQVDANSIEIVIDGEPVRIVEVSEKGAQETREDMLDGEGLDEELSKYEVALMESRLAKAPLILPHPHWELHQNLLGALDTGLTSYVEQNCAVM